MEWSESHNLATQVSCSITFLLCLIDFNSDFQRLSSYSEENWLVTELIGFPCLQNRAQEEKRHRREEEGRDSTSGGVTALPHALPLINCPSPGATYCVATHRRNQSSWLMTGKWASPKCQQCQMLPIQPTGTPTMAHLIELNRACLLWEPLLVKTPRFVPISSGDDHSGSLLHTCSRHCVSYAGFHPATLLSSRCYAFAGGTSVTWCFKCMLAVTVQQVVWPEYRSVQLRIN